MGFHINKVSMKFILQSLYELHFTPSSFPFEALLGDTSARIMYIQYVHSVQCACIRVELQCVAVERATEFRGESPATSRRSRDSPTESFPSLACSLAPSLVVVHFLARKQPPAA